MPLLSTRKQHKNTSATPDRTGARSLFGERTRRTAERSQRRFDELHGPYHQWTRKIDGKTVTVNLTEEQVTRYGPWFASARALRAALNELEELSLHIAQREEGWR